MIETPQQAVDECAAVLMQALVAAPTVLVLWEGVPTGQSTAVSGLPPADAAWCRWSMRHQTDGITAFSCTYGKRRFTPVGIIHVQCFSPLVGEGKFGAMKLAALVRDAYCGDSTPSGVWFRRQRINEVGGDASWYRADAYIDFTYDQMR